MGWWRNRRRKKLLATPFPEAWEAILRRRLAFYGELPAEPRDRFRDFLRIFLAEKHFVGAQGLAVTEEMRVVIAGLAVRLVLQLDLSLYDRLAEIVVYPFDYRHREGEDRILGEANRWGTVVLSWPAVQAGLINACDGHDTATHEFAHVLDHADGGFDGTPPLRTSEHYRPWAEVMSRHFLRLRDGAWPERRVLREYGAKNEAEFFAVATEAFFERARRMREETPELYAELARFYGFDPAAEDRCP